MRPWILNPYKPHLETLAGVPILTLQWVRADSGGGFHHFVSYRSSSAFNANAATPVYRRLFAHLALDELPDEALAEVLECLANAWAFHQPVVPPSGSEQPLTRRGKITKRYERPTYSIEE